MENKNRSLFHSILFYSLFLIFIFELLFFTYSITKYDFRIKKSKRNISIAYKSKDNNYYPDVCFGNIFFCSKLEPINNVVIDTSKIGEYKVKYNYRYSNKEKEIDQTIKVVDNTRPIIYIPEGKLTICPNGKLNSSGIKVIDDYDGDITNNVDVIIKRNLVTIKAIDSHGNKSIKRINVDIKDNDKPKLELIGNSDKYFLVGANYEDEGVVVTDNCDADLNVDVSSGVDYNKPGKYEIVYRVTDSSNNTSEIKRNVTIVDKDQTNKVIYLTFDDGPSIYTNQLLDVLAKYNVKATFFVTSNGSDETILREYNEGHTIGLHTYTHDYAYVYSSVDNYFEDLENIKNRVKNITGYESNIIRFPGGSSNTVSSNYKYGIMSTLVDEVTKRGYYYFDWNVSSGDAGGTTTSDGVYNNVVSTLKDDYSVVLQHDIKGFSVDAVESIIQYGLANGYTFKPLTIGSPGAHHGVNN